MIALCNGKRIEARLADRRQLHECPGCGAYVILKRGRKVVPHFAHKATQACPGSQGETVAHYRAKENLAEAFRARGIKAEIEFIFEGFNWARRADVTTWSPTSGQPIAFELQKSVLSLNELEERSFDYARAFIAQCWLPFLPPGFEKRVTQLSKKVYCFPRYTPKQHEFWAHGLYDYHGCWMVDPKGAALWFAKLEGHDLKINEALWYERGADKRYSPARTRRSTKFRDLILQGPYKFSDLRVTISSREEFQTDLFHWPMGRVVSFIPQED